MMKRFAENTSRSAQRCMKGIINAGVRFVMERCEDATEKYASGDSGNAAASGVRGGSCRVRLSRFCISVRRPVPRGRMGHG